MSKSASKLKFRKKNKKDVFDEPVIKQETETVQRAAEKQPKNIMLSMLKGTILTYSVKVDSSYELLLCGLDDKEGFYPLINLVSSETSSTDSNGRSLITKVIDNVNGLLSNAELPLDYLEPEEIQSSFGSISKENNRLEVKIL